MSKYVNLKLGDSKKDKKISRYLSAIKDDGINISEHVRIALLEKQIADSINRRRDEYDD